MSKEMASQWLNATDNINFDVFVPFENETSLEQVREGARSGKQFRYNHEFTNLTLLLPTVGA